MVHWHDRLPVLVCHGVFEVGEAAGGLVPVGSGHDGNNRLAAAQNLCEGTDKVVSTLELVHVQENAVAGRLEVLLQHGGRVVRILVLGCRPARLCHSVGYHDIEACSFGHSAWSK